MAKEEIMSELDLDTLPDVEQVTPDTPKKVIRPADPERDGVVEVEVVDDTPEEDRGRQPLPKEVVEQLDNEDEVENVSAKVKQRIDQMRKAYHDERRAREAAQRERDEAARVAQMTYAEKVALQQRLSQGEVWAVDQAKNRALLSLEMAKREYRDAYEAGDTDKVIEAQQKLNSAMFEAQRYASYVPQYTFQQREALQQQQIALQRAQEAEYADSAPEPDPKAVKWGERNQWFGEDDEMTSFALGVHQKLIREGISPDTDEYYERLDARIKQVFPAVAGGQPQRQSSTVVAPVGRSPKGKKVVLTKSQIALANRLGITPEQYARELVKQQEK